MFLEVAPLLPLCVFTGFFLSFIVLKTLTFSCLRQVSWIFSRTMITVSESLETWMYYFNVTTYLLLGWKTLVVTLLWKCPWWWMNWNRIYFIIGQKCAHCMWSSACFWKENAYILYHIILHYIILNSAMVTLGSFENLKMRQFHKETHCLFELF